MGKHEQQPKVRYQLTEPHAKTSHEGIIKANTSCEPFDTLFDSLANEAVLSAKFPAEKPQQEDRIPIIVKKKVASLWQKGICYPDAKPACFRMADTKRGGPYSWFSYYSSNQTIFPNWEYFVQVAAFHDLIIEFGYLPEWMKFEYHETVPPVWLAIDIGINFPDGRKAFVEVKERKEQWEALIAEVKSIGHRGVDFNTPDRGNDPLRKAKYIVAGRPDFFVGYFPGGFDTYKVAYKSAGQFTLEPTGLPHGQRFVGSFASNRKSKESSDKGVNLIEKLIAFLQEGFRDPVQIFDYLRSRKRCFGCITRCEELIPYFQRPNPWNQYALDQFFSWSNQWYPPKRYEETIYAFFFLPRIAQFLSSKMGTDELDITRIFHMEFKGGGKKKHNVPPCLWRGVGGTCVSKEFRNHQMCCDFFLKQTFPPVVGEVKVAVAQNIKNVFNIFLRIDLEKCKEWLQPDTIPFVEEKFGIEGGFKYALAIFIDLTGGEEFREFWKLEINELDLHLKGILPRLISPFNS